MYICIHMYICTYMYTCIHIYQIPVTKDSTTGEVTGLLYDVNTDISAAPALVRTSGTDA